MIDAIIILAATAAAIVAVLLLWHLRTGHDDSAELFERDWFGDDVERFVTSEEDCTR